MLPGVTIVFSVGSFKRAAVTGADGTYLLSGLPSGSATIAEKPCPALLSLELSVSPRRTVITVPTGMVTICGTGLLAADLPAADLLPAAPLAALSPAALGFSVEDAGVLRKMSPYPGRLMFAIPYWWMPREPEYSMPSTVFGTSSCSKAMLYIWAYAVLMFGSTARRLVAGSALVGGVLPANGPALLVVICNEPGFVTCALGMQRLPLSRSKYQYV